MVSDEDTALPPEAQRAWFAYRDMCASKREYFSLLSELEQRQNDTGAAPTEQENQRLSELLQVHDHNVKAFNEAMASISEPASRQALLVRLQADQQSDKS